MSGGGEPGPVQSGFVDAELAAELPGIGLRWAAVPHGSGRSNDGLRTRLAILADRFTGAQAIELRRRPIPWAYRVFFRHIGLDPDEQLTPVEALALERLRKGGFPSQNLLDDALTIAIMESGVALRRLRRRSGRAATRDPAEQGGRGTRRPADAAACRDAGDRRLARAGLDALRGGRRGSRRQPTDPPHDRRCTAGRRRARHRRRGGALAASRRPRRGRLRSAEIGARRGYNGPEVERGKGPKGAGASRGRARRVESGGRQRRRDGP